MRYLLSLPLLLAGCVFQAAEANQPIGSAPADNALLERDAKPTFTWTAVPGATRYLVRVRRVSDDTLVFAASTTEASVAFNQNSLAPFPPFPELFPALSAGTLGRGLLYEWTVENLRYGQPSKPGGAESVETRSSPIYRFTIK